MAIATGRALSVTITIDNQTVAPVEIKIDAPYIQYRGGVELIKRYLRVFSTGRGFSGYDHILPMTIPAQTSVTKDIPDTMDGDIAGSKVLYVPTSTFTKIIFTVVESPGKFTLPNAWESMGVEPKTFIIHEPLVDGKTYILK